MPVRVEEYSATKATIQPQHSHTVARLPPRSRPATTRKARRKANTYGRRRTVPARSPAMLSQSWAMHGTLPRIAPLFQRSLMGELWAPALGQVASQIYSGLASGCALSSNGHARAGRQPEAYVAVRAEGRGPEARAELNWRSKLAQCPTFSVVPSFTCLC